jgi:hypothetical protein
MSFSFAMLQAQENANASGGNAIGSNGSVSYSAGQPIYTTQVGTNGSVAQGVQQPYEISIVTEIKEAKDISLSFLVYPNPTNNFLKLKVENYNSHNLSYTLSELSGKIIETKKMESSESSIIMEHLANGVYFLKVTEYDNELKTFKIIKN